MLSTRLKIKEIGEGVSREALMERLYAIGYVTNISIDKEQKWIAFDYATFRDKNGVLMELRKMGILCVNGMNLTAERKSKKGTVVVPSK